MSIFSMEPREKWLEYERRKRELYALDLTPEEYTAAIERILEDLQL